MLVFGDLGSGKTALVTGFVLDALRNGFPAFLNFSVGVKEEGKPQGKIVKMFSQVRKFAVSELIGFDVAQGFVGCSEVYTLAESRVSSSKLNRFFSYFIFQSRKMKVDVGTDAQLVSSVDLRLVSLADLLVLCERNEELKRFDYTFVRNGLKPVVEYRWLSFDFMAEYVFPYFDSWEAVNPVGMVDLQVEMERFDVDKINERVDFVTDLFMQKGVEYGLRSERDVYKFMVDDFCLRYGFPLALSGFVVSRLKSRLRLHSIS